MTTETTDPAPHPQKLRVAVLLEDLRPPAWVARVIRDLQGCPEVTLVALGQTGASASAHSEPIAARALRRLYELADARAFPLPSDPFEQVEISRPSGSSAPSASSAPAGSSGPSGPLPDLDVLSLHPRASHEASTLELADDELARLARHRLDVILSFLPRALGGGVLSCARYGVWTYHFGEERPARGGPAGFWEVVDRAPVTRSALHAQFGAHHARILYESWSATDPVSVRRSRASCYWKSSAFVLRSLRELHELGQAALERKPLVPIPPPRTLAASGREMAVALARFGGAIVRREAHRRTIRDQWTLAYRLDPGHRGSVPVRALAGVTRLSPPLDRFWADPFIARHGDGWTVLFEEKLYAERKAHISALHIDREGRASEPERVLEREYHLSYPFLLSWDGAWWMIPETARNRTVELWRAVELPRRWKLERTLLEGVQAVDSTLFEHEGVWWLYCNIGEPGASREEELHLFHAPSPLGPWTPHRRNPVKSDIRSARPAGRPFWTDGAWHRPAQDGSGSYGSGIAIHRIERLDPHDFEERQVSRLAPDWEPRLTGLHTINACDGLTVIDVRVARPRLGALGALGRWLA